MLARSSNRLASNIEQSILRIISKRKAIQPSRLQPATKLSDELGFDVVDVVDIILAVERRFHIVIPDEVPLNTVSDFINWVGKQLPRRRSAARATVATA